MAAHSPLVLETLNSIPRHSGGVGVYAEKLLQAYVHEAPGFNAPFGFLDTWSGEKNWGRNFQRYRYFYGLPPRHGGEIILHVVSAFRSPRRNLSRELRGVNRFRIVATHHDFIDLDYPWLFDQSELRARIDAYREFSNYFGIVVPSRGVGARLVAEYCVAPNRIAVIPHGNSQHLEVAPDPSATPEGRYILYTGKLYPHKNWRRMLSACAALIEDFRRAEVTLALVSSDAEAKSTELKEALDEGGLGGIVQVLPYATNAQLASLFARCSGYVFPSLAEGFGMPAFEAQALGAPICLSDLPVFREVMSIGDYPSTWFDPFSKDLMVEALRGFLSRIDEPRPRPFLRTWRTVAREHLEFIYGLSD